MPKRLVSAQRLIHAPASRIFDVLANPYEHHRIDGSGSVQQPRPGTATRLFLGATFSMDMNMKVSYFTNNKVVAFEENRTIAWHHAAKFIWRYDLEDRGTDTLVTESFDYSKPWGLLIVPLGWPEKNRIAMESTLARLALAVED